MLLFGPIESSKKLICEPEESLKKAEAYTSILKDISETTFTEKSEFDLTNFYSWITFLIIISITIMLMLISTMWRSNHTKKKFERMRSEWLETFHAGQEQLIDWNEDIVLQAEFLPYRSEFEFPIENLEIGSEIGHGEFGVVHEALARGLGGNDKSEIKVAVKKSKNLKLSEIKAFADELKIMMFLQKVNKQSHVNIINLLGSITVDIKKGEICAILEFCEKGNLKDFIVRNSRMFVDQLNSETTNEFELNHEADNNEYR